MTLSKLDAFQIIKSVFDDVASAIAVKITDTALSIELDAADGDSVVSYGSLGPKQAYNKIEYTYPNATTTVMTFKQGLTTVGTLTKIYTDATKTALVSEEFA